LINAAKRLTGKEFDFAKYFTREGKAEVKLFLLLDIPREALSDFINHASFYLRGKSHIYKCERGSIRFWGHEVHFRLVRRLQTERRLTDQEVTLIPPGVVQQFATNQADIIARDPRPHREEPVFASIPSLPQCFCTN
jgi:hypothetical protein